MGMKAITKTLGFVGMVGALLGGFSGVAHAEKADPLGAKMGVYIRMINTWSNPVFESRSRYFDVVDGKVGITCKEQSIQSLQTAPFGYSDMTVKDLPKFRSALKKGPKLDSDGAALKMLDAMDQILKVDDRVTHYFSLAKYKADDCARGKEIHATLLAAWPKFAEGDKEVRAVVEKYSDDQALVKLADAEKKFGKGLHFYQRRLLIDAKALIKAVDGTDKALADPAPVREKAAALQKSYEEVKPLFTKYNARDDAGDTAAYSYMLSHVQELVAGAERRAKSIDDDIKRKVVGKYASSEVRQLVDIYNKFVESSNRVEFGKAMK
jgi:hypothetical protein